MALGIDHVNIRIPEEGVEEAVQFYQEVLGFTPEKLDLYRDGERTSFAFRVAETAMIHVRPVDHFEAPGDDNFDHFCVLVDGSIDEIKETLEQHGIGIEREGTPWGSTGRAPAVYIRDPFGYLLELKAAQ